MKGKTESEQLNQIFPRHVRVEDGIVTGMWGQEEFKHGVWHAWGEVFVFVKNRWCNR